jgi:hypothetical protein
LCDRLKDLAKRGFGCTPYQVRRAAFVFAENRGLKHPWRNTKIAGKDWFTAFLKRNRDISLRIPEGLSKARAEGMNRKVVEDLFLLIKEATQELGIQESPE